ncbi:NO-inducible flavohemoprotein [Vibrio sp. SS-MA-C1-2]|uniref:NO-inducible flavohemoprotein n=1 Tax=Vibrio sp. SS-MA-C1-2 TaxID=2908646 RepID=UPI001F1F0449|nr:NO-inducible flavohemoprotein [Vibrio sp. SS-MA-C1-2]UJF17422.1 NO-inducible flavohemoprotein [Vibrio sp. SS-MA-C1-2]
MLSQKTIDIVKSTAPVIAETGPKLTAHFYDRMFSRHPELKDIFNMANQRSGNQREALFNAVYGYAANIDNIEVLLPVVEKIAQKHTSFNITAAQYNVVGENLLATIDELLSPGQEVLDAWAEAYGLLAQVFINREEEIYSETESQEGGWRGLREFVLTEKTEESKNITSFVFTPKDGESVIGYKPGQYIGIYINDDKLENQEIRQYSLSDQPNGKTYRISVKRESHGIVSQYLHDDLNVGDIIKLAPPAGDFFFTTEETKPVVLMSAGVGVTPMLSMLETIKDSHKANIVWIHAAENSEQHSFNDHISSLVAQYNNVEQHVWYSNDKALAAQHDHINDGFVKLSTLGLDWENSDFYFCGPVGFMQAKAQQLTDLNVKPEQINYEVFGPHKVL